MENENMRVKTLRMKKFLNTKLHMSLTGLCIAFFFHVLCLYFPAVVYSAEDSNCLNAQKKLNKINQQVILSPLTISKESEKLFWNYSQKLLKNVPDSDGLLILKTAELFLNTPYKAFTLEHEKEILFSSFTQLDCTTFVDTVLALAGSIRDTQRFGKIDLNNFARRLQKSRYRNSTVQYTERLHYIIDWGREQEKFGRLKDITPMLGGIPKKLNFSEMSAYVQKDPRFASNPAVINEIKNQERKISETPMYVIPTDKINSILHQMQTGDIIGFVPPQNNCDVIHLAIFAGKQPDIPQPTFIHNTSPVGKVSFEPYGLIPYLEDVKNNSIGIIIFRCSLDSDLF